MLPNPLSDFTGKSNTEAIGSVLYTDYILYFQLSGVILLVAMIGSIVLTLREREGVKRQVVSEQLQRQGKIDLVDVFRPSNETPGIAKETVNKKGKVLWLQYGIENDEAEKIASDLNVEVKDVLHMENRLSSNDSSFDSPVSSGDDDEIMSPSQYLEDKRYDPEVIVASEQAEQLNKEDLLSALKTLDDRSKDILSRRYLADNKATLHDLADEYKNFSLSSLYSLSLIHI